MICFKIDRLVTPHFRPIMQRFPILIVALVVSAAGNLPAELRSFTSTSGETMQMELIGHKITEDSLILKTEDGRELTGVDINLFAEGDREYIRKWMDETTPTLDYHFRYEVKTEKIDSTRNKIDSYKTVGASTTAYEVKMTNLSRDTVGPLKVAYVFFVDNFVDGGMTTSGQNREVQISGSLPIAGRLGFNHTATVQTKPTTLEMVDYDYGNLRERDRLAGIMLRVYDSGENLVNEFKSSEVSKKKWPREEETKEGKVIIR